MSLESSSKTSSFFVRDCAFATLATGCKAHTLREFRDLLRDIPAESVYHHFWRQTIETSLPPGSFYNDFSHWAHYDLHDDFLAERLTWINPTEYRDLEFLRNDVVQILEKRMHETEATELPMITAPFYFVKSKIVIFSTEYRIDDPKELVKIFPKVSVSSLFYHFIDARGRQPTKQDDFSVWLQGYGEQYLPLIQRFAEIDPYFISLADLHLKLTITITDYFLKEIPE